MWSIRCLGLLVDVTSTENSYHFGNYPYGRIVIALYDDRIKLWVYWVQYDPAVAPCVTLRCFLTFIALHRVPVSAFWVEMILEFYKHNLPLPRTTDISPEQTVG